MPKHDIPDQVRRFILTSIASVPHLEALMLLRGSAPQRWSAAELAQRLYVPAAVARTVLEESRRAGMVHCDEASATYTFGPEHAELASVIDALALLYSSHLVEITMLIHAKLDRKAQQFANAFQFRKDT